MPGMASGKESPRREFEGAPQMPLSSFRSPEWVPDYRFIVAATQAELLDRLKSENRKLIDPNKSGPWRIISFALGLDGYEALLQREVWRVPE
jgi:hypothetical protein